MITGWGIVGAYWLLAILGFRWVASAGIQVPDAVLFLPFLGSAILSSIAVGVSFFWLAQYLLVRRHLLWFPPAAAMYLLTSWAVLWVIGSFRSGLVSPGAFFPREINLLVLLFFLAWPFMSVVLATLSPD